MEYRIYTTPAIVLARRPSGEANSIVWLLTRDCGLLTATVQRGRDVTSKMRFGLQTFSLSTVSLVRGRSYWRVVNVIPHRSYFSRLATDTTRVDVAAKVMLTLRHLVAGEAADPELFSIMHTTLNWLAADRDLPQEKQRAVECIAVTRILHRLGYMGENKYTSSFVETHGFSAPLISLMEGYQGYVTGIINDALEASHLIPASESENARYSRLHG